MAIIAPGANLVRLLWRRRAAWRRAAVVVPSTPVGANDVQGEKSEPLHALVVHIAERRLGRGYFVAFHRRLVRLRDLASVHRRQVLHLALSGKVCVAVNAPPKYIAGSEEHRCLIIRRFAG